MKVLLSIILPTLNEHDNILLLLEALLGQLSDFQGGYEIIIVDDHSPDGTAAIVDAFRKNHPDVNLLRREGRRDLSSALAYGFDHAHGDYLLAMDADMQHDPAAVLRMLGVAQRVGADLVVATRYSDGGSIADWPGTRRCLSLLATKLAKSVLRCQCSDPLSGFFLISNARWQQVRSRVRLSGYKLLLEILLVEPGLHCAESGYRFVARRRGNSKLGVAAIWSFTCSLIRRCR